MNNLVQVRFEFLACEPGYELQKRCILHSKKKNPQISWVFFVELKKFLSMTVECNFLTFLIFFAIFAIDNLHTIEVSRCAELKMKKKCILSVFSDIYIDLLLHTKGLKTFKRRMRSIPIIYFLISTYMFHF